MARSSPSDFQTREDNNVRGVFLLLLAGALGSAGGAAAQNLAPGDWAAMASDRVARHVGDSVTVAIIENSSASNSQQSQSGRSAQLQAQAGTGSSPGHSVQLGASGAAQGQ